ncbi:TRAP transporter small permease subunit [Thalassococcus lentus]|uniref:TRAP transporter small permease protein n=1 Tax=Thalassococcus lentus TaxID=1210524 RepID=A0ABT4XSJ1_9RHOB|nr:TRAP transporter small permease subunit [Thalassococcus lentus]MDA7424813.1 TRAP transporter small permease subunit [Thalassococcus lentus]
MQDGTDPQVAEMPVAIYDPGEIDRAEHNKGDRLVVGISNIFAWIFPILMIAICAQVILRQAGHNQAWLDDFQWWLYGAAVLIGVAYAVTTNSHVRVDIFYDNYDPKRKARIDIFALVWCFLPFVILSWDVTFGYAIASVMADEGSDSPNGLHNLWILKILLNLSFVLMAVALWSMYLRRMKVLTEPTLGRKLLWAFPSTMFVVNLILYYVLYSYHWLTLPEGQIPRTISRKPIFDEFEAGPWDIKYTIVISLGLTLMLIGAAILRDARRAR